MTVLLFFRIRKLICKILTYIRGVIFLVFFFRIYAVLPLIANATNKPHPTELLIVRNPTKIAFHRCLFSFVRENTRLSVTIETRYSSGVRKYDVMLTQRQIIDDSSIARRFLPGGVLENLYQISLSLGR